MSLQKEIVDSDHRQTTIRIDEMYNLDLPIDIRQEAEQFYLKIFKKRKRKLSRKMGIIYAVQQVYFNRGEYFDIVHLGALVGLNESDSMKAITICLKTSSLYDLPEIHTGQVEPLAMINYYCGERVLNLDEEDRERILNVYEIAEENSIFDNEGKKARVAACIHYYIRSKGMPIDEKKYSQAFPGVTTKKVEDLSYKISFLFSEP